MALTKEEEKGILESLIRQVEATAFSITTQLQIAKKIGDTKAASSLQDQASKVLMTQAELEERIKNMQKEEV